MPTNLPGPGTEKPCGELHRDSVQSITNNSNGCSLENAKTASPQGTQLGRVQALESRDPVAHAPGARLDLDEDESRALTGDEINLPVPHTDVSRENLEPMPPEVPCCDTLPQLPQGGARPKSIPELS